MNRTFRRRALIVAAVASAFGAASAPALAAAPHNAHGDLLKLRANTNESSNWFGYNQGSIEQGGKLFHSIAGDWTVPTATSHTKGQDQFSSDWIGIGGGCVDANCLVTDNTLIQTGTEQDVSSSGKSSYGAWWEIIPAPSLTINKPVSAGDHMHASIAEVVPNSNVWTITLKDVTKGWTFTQTVPYTSTHATAEWIEETPLILGTNAGFAALPNLTNPSFRLARTNGANPKLKPAEKMFLVDGNGKVIGAPSNPISTLDGFSECAWSSTC